LTSQVANLHGRPCRNRFRHRPIHGVNIGRRCLHVR